MSKNILFHANKKMHILLVHLLVFFIPLSLGCEKQELDPVTLDNTFNVFFYQDFNDKSTGIYSLNDWRADWNYPAWVNRQVPPTIVSEQNDGLTSKYMRWQFPKGSVGPSQGGGQWITYVQEPFEEVYFSYRLRFKPGFEWVLGGKIPGVQGGPQWEGFDPPAWDEGFVALLMWTTTGNLSFYYYHHNQTHVYGDSKVWDYRMETGRWYNITIRIVMNTVDGNGGNNDGIMEGFIDGKLVAQHGDICFRNISSIGMDQLCITSFFGGSGEDWTAIRDEWIDVDDFILFTYKEHADVPKGNILSDRYKELLLPYRYIKNKTF